MGVRFLGINGNKIFKYIDIFLGEYREYMWIEKVMMCRVDLSRLDWVGILGVLEERESDGWELVIK